MPIDKWLRENQKIRTRRQLAESYSGKHTPLVALTIPFGKHRGKSLSNIPKDYLRWLLDESNIKGSLRRQVLIEYNSRD